MRFPAWWAVAALVVVPALVAPAAAQHAGGGAGGPHGAPRTTASVSLPTRSALDAALPDTTLARIFFASRGRVDIGITAVRQAAGKLGARPDSLTPEATRQVLGLLVQRAVLARKAHEKPRAWTPADSADYQALVDRLTLGAALEKATGDLGFELLSRGDSVPPPGLLGAMARDSAIARAHPAYDDSAAAMLGRAFAARPQPTSDMDPISQLRLNAVVPELAAADSARTILSADAGVVTAGRVLTDFARIVASRRPAIRTAEDVKAMARNSIFEQMLRDDAKRGNYAARPRIAAQLADRAELLDIQEYVTRNVYAKVPTDSATLQREFRAHREKYRMPGHAVVVQTLSAARTEADSLARSLTVPGVAESLATRSARAGVPYEVGFDEPADSALFARMRHAGVGAVIGPDTVSAGWRVLKVMRLTEHRDMTFAEAHDTVLSDWRERDGERRMQALLGGLMQSTIVRTNDASPYLTGRRRLNR